MPDLTFADGVLFFPVTPFDAGDRVDHDLLAAHVSQRVDQGCGGVFAACGTGEYHALDAAEHAAVVRTAVAATRDRVPVLAGAGGPIAHARACARAAADARADGLLVMPPYLVAGPQAGLVAYVRAIVAASDLPVVVYHRANAALTPSTVRALLEIPEVVGIKDGVGDIALTQEFVRITAREGRDLMFFNGLLTAELSQAAYRAVGVPLYSSAAFAMAPDVACAFHTALRDGDEATRVRLLDEFYLPLVRLRDETPGFAVSLIKAGLRIQGMAVGSVRPPLIDPDPDQTDRLARLLDTGRSLVA